MFPVSVTFIVLVVINLTVGILLYLWLKGDQGRSDSSPPRLKAAREVRCPICGHEYSAVPIDDLTVCPSCNSYNRGE